MEILARKFARAAPQRRSPASIRCSSSRTAERDGCSGARCAWASEAKQHTLIVKHAATRGAVDRANFSIGYRESMIASFRATERVGATR
jgi:hypothetical protein